MLHFGVLNNVLSIDYFQKLINLQIVHYSLAWLGVYMLGYYNFSIGWMVTPLLLRWTKTTLHIYEKHIQYILNPWQIISDSDISWFLSSVLRDQWKKEKRKRLTAAREAALTNEQVGIHLFDCFIFVLLLHVTKFQIVKIQAMLEARMGVEELPSWVFFPDKERAEWVNTMLKQVSLQIAKKILLWWRNNKFDMMGQHNA